MKIVTFCLLGALCISGCKTHSSPENDSNSIDISVEMDTVKVDAGDELIYVGWNLTSSGESPDGKYLYNFNRTSPISLEVIDLENLKLDQVIPLEVEGPNGVGSQYISRVLVTEDGNLIFTDGYQFGVFDGQLTKLNSIRLDKEAFITDAIPEGNRLWFDQALSADGKKLIALHGGAKMGDPKEGAIIIDLENRTSRLVPLEFVKSWSAYQILFTYNGQPMNAMFSPTNLLVTGDSLVFSIGAENKVYFLDLSTDSLSSRTYESQYTSPISTGGFPEQVDSEEKFQEVVNAMEKEVRYRNFLFDVKNTIYWRFATESSRSNRTVLTAFSREFEQLGEVLLPEDFKVPSKVFVRDGMIYTYLNQDDEVYFVRLKPEIKN